MNVRFVVKVTGSAIVNVEADTFEEAEAKLQNSPFHDFEAEGDYTVIDVDLDNG